MSVYVMERALPVDPSLLGRSRQPQVGEWLCLSVLKQFTKLWYIVNSCERRAEEEAGVLLHYEGGPVVPTRSGYLSAAWLAG